MARGPSRQQTSCRRHVEGIGTTVRKLSSVRAKSQDLSFKMVVKLRYRYMQERKLWKKIAS